MNSEIVGLSECPWPCGRTGGDITTYKVIDGIATCPHRENGVDLDAEMKRSFVEALQTRVVALKEERDE